MNLELDLFSLKEDDPPIIVKVGKGACRLKFDASIVQRILFQAIINYHSQKQLWINIYVHPWGGIQSRCWSRGGRRSARVAFSDNYAECIGC